MTYDPRAHGALCDRCPLSKNRKQPNIPVSPEHAKNGKTRFVVVAEHPGRYEEKLLRPLVGPSGQVLDRALTKAGLDRKDAFLTNAALCRMDEDDKKNEIAFECCAPRLLRELGELPADIPILTMGKPATRAVLGVKSIFLARGFVWVGRLLEKQIKDVETNLRRATKRGERDLTEMLERKRVILQGRDALAGRTVFPTLNTAFVLKADAWKPIVELDIRRLARWLSGKITYETLHDMGPHLVVAGADSTRRALAKLGTSCSLDIETDGVIPLVSDILCVGLASLNAPPVVIGPWRKDIHARLLTQALKTRTAITHNGMNFDVIALERDGVEFPRTPQGFIRINDTLIAHHTYASHMFQRLDHVASVFTDSSPWKMLNGRKGVEEKGLLPIAMSPDQRHLYNAKDCREQVVCWHRMQADLKPQLEIYKLDMKVAEICKEMQVDGIRRDEERASYLVELMKRRNRYLAKEMRKLAGKKSFAPTKTADVRKALYGRLRTPVTKLTPTGLTATNAAVLEALKINSTRAGKFSRHLLDWRAIDKVRSTYIEKVSVLGDGRVHPNWKSFGAVTGRFSCRLQSVPRLVLTHRAQVLLAKNPRWRPEDVEKEIGRDATYEIESRIREVYVPEPGHVYIYFDLSQSEMRVAAYVSGDETFMRSCESGDVHTANAKILFASDETAMDILNRDPKGEGKIYRDITKNAGFGILYKAETAHIFEFLASKGFEVELSDVETMFDTVHETYHRYYKFCDQRVAFVQKHGYLCGVNSGRMRRFGYHPKPTEVYNFSIQEFVAHLMNTRMIELRRRMPGGTRIVGQWHDALVIEAREGRDADALLRFEMNAETGKKKALGIVPDIWAETIHVKSSGVDFVMPIDAKRGYRLSDFC